MKRRVFLGATFAAAAIAGLGITGLRYADVLTGFYRRRLQDDFGPALNDEVAVTEFLADFVQRVTRDYYPRQSFFERIRSNASVIKRDILDERRGTKGMTIAFLHSTNVIRVLDGSDTVLEYSGLFDPYELTCGNRLSAQWA